MSKIETAGVADIAQIFLDTLKEFPDRNTTIFPRDSIYMSPIVIVNKAWSDLEIGPKPDEVGQYAQRWKGYSARLIRYWLNDLDEYLTQGPEFKPRFTPTLGATGSELEVRGEPMSVDISQLGENRYSFVASRNISPQNSGITVDLDNRHRKPVITSFEAYSSWVADTTPEILKTVTEYRVSYEKNKISSFKETISREDGDIGAQMSEGGRFLKLNVRLLKTKLRFKPTSTHL